MTPERFAEIRREGEEGVIHTDHVKELCNEVERLTRQRDELMECRRQPLTEDEKPCDDCQTCHCPTTWAKKRIAALTKERDEARAVATCLSDCDPTAPCWYEHVESADAAVERWRAESAAVPKAEESVAVPSGGLVRHIIFVDGVTRPSAMPTWSDWFVGGESIGSVLKEFEGKRIRVTVEALPDLPKAELPPRCRVFKGDGRPCIARDGHDGKHLYVGTSTPEELGESKRVSDLLHPDGRCACAGEGTCEWCRTHCYGCGVRVEPSVGDMPACAECRAKEEA